MGLIQEMQSHKQVMDALAREFDNHADAVRPLESDSSATLRARAKKLHGYVPGDKSRYESAVTEAVRLGKAAKTAQESLFALVDQGQVKTQEALDASREAQARGDWQEAQAYQAAAEEWLAATNEAHQASQVVGSAMEANLASVKAMQTEYQGLIYAAEMLQSALQGALTGMTEAERKELSALENLINMLKGAVETVSDLLYLFGLGVLGYLAYKLVKAVK